MKLKFPVSISNSSTLEELIRFTSVALERLQTIINGNINYGDNIAGKADLLNNVNVQVITIVFPSATTVAAAHTLGSVPRGYIKAGASAAMSLSNGNQPNTASTIYIASSAAGTAKVMVF